MLKKMTRTHPHVSAKRHMRASVMVDASSSVVSSKHLKGQLSHNSIVTTSSIYLYIYIFIFHLVDSTQPAATPPYTWFDSIFGISHDETLNDLKPLPHPPPQLWEKSIIHQISPLWHHSGQLRAQPCNLDGCFVFSRLLLIFLNVLQLLQQKSAQYLATTLESSSAPPNWAGRITAETLGQRLYPNPYWSGSIKPVRRKLQYKTDATSANSELNEVFFFLFFFLRANFL